MLEIRIQFRLISYWTRLLVELPYNEKYGKRVYVTELCDYPCPDDAISISFVIKKGSPYLKDKSGHPS